MLEFFYKGGLLMYPILAGSILTLTFGLERAFHYIRARSRNGTLSKIKSLIEEGKYDEAHALAKETPGPVSAVIAEALQHKKETQLAIEEAISLKGSAEIKKLNKNLHILELTGRITPLLGLLGTVIGMAKAFHNIAVVQGPVNPSVLAGGIWEALITTVAGLSVAIPALILHHIFEDKVKNFAFLMKHYGAETVRLLGGASK